MSMQISCTFTDNKYSGVRMYQYFSISTHAVYEDIYDAKRAVDHLSGFNVGGRYLVVMYYQPAKFQKRADAEEKKRELEELRRQVKLKKAQMASVNDDD